MILTVLITVYNEKSTIQEVIERVKKSPVEKKVIIINDGSNDGTKERKYPLVTSLVLRRPERKSLGKIGF